MTWTAIRPCSALALLLSLAACPSDDGDDADETTADDDTTAADATSAGDTTLEETSTDGPLPDPGIQNDPCVCDGGDPNACDAAGSNCGDPLSCIAGSCRETCESLDDESCPEGTVCFALEIDEVDLGFWCG